MEMDFNAPQRQSAVGIVVMFFDTLRQYIKAFFPLVIIYVVNFDKVNKLYLILSAVPSVIAFAFSIYMASYGKDGLQILNPGVYLISLLVFSMFFGMAVLLDYGFDVIIDR